MVKNVKEIMKTEKENIKNQLKESICSQGACLKSESSVFLL